VRVMTSKLKTPASDVTAGAGRGMPWYQPPSVARSCCCCCCDPACPAPRRHTDHRRTYHLPRIQAVCGQARSSGRRQSTIPPTFFKSKIRHQSPYDLCPQAASDGQNRCFGSDKIERKHTGTSTELKPSK